MSKELQCILLVDDDPATNFLNEELISDMDIVDNIRVALNGKEALDYILLEGKFAKSTRETNPIPNIVFLDINMPLMGGFEFLDKYSLLDDSLKSDAVIVFLTTSNMKEEMFQSRANEFVYDFIQKPLREDTVRELVHKYNTKVPKT